MSDITPMAAVPSEVNYGRITAHFVAFLADLEDDDFIPDEIPLNGTVILTPTVGILKFPNTVPPRTAVIQTVRCPLIEGHLYPPDTPLEGPLPPVPGVIVVASDQPAGLPSTVQWTASFSLENTSAQPNPVTFDVPANGVVDLTTVMPTTPEPGLVVVVSTESRDRAETAAATATSQATSAASSATAAATSATNAATSASAAATSATAAASSAGSISWAGLPGKPAVIAAGATAADARTAIDAVALTPDAAIPILESGVTVQVPRLVKQGKLVVCNLIFTAVAVGTWYVKQLTIPAGFRPKYNLGVNSWNGKRTLIETGGGLYMENPVATTDDRITVTWEIA